MAAVVGLGVSRGYVLFKMASRLGTSVGRLVPWKAILHMGVYSMIAGGAARLAVDHLRIPELALVGVAILVFAAVYFPLVWYSGLVAEDEKELVRPALMSVRSAMYGLGLVKRSSV
jgi:hypothetical protein